MISPSGVSSAKSPWPLSGLAEYLHTTAVAKSIMHKAIIKKLVSLFLNLIKNSFILDFALANLLFFM